ncbi:hypothetical protein DL96DRAFT_1557099 [Flagelloscypha sp. PMI_526]|nr:hypothetical protein DL96DRAFT_1557099 [Flagelloscypha sp. PMI_526]
MAFDPYHHHHSAKRKHADRRDPPSRVGGTAGPHIDDTIDYGRRMQPRQRLDAVSEPDRTAEFAPRHLPPMGPPTNRSRTPTTDSDSFVATDEDLLEAQLLCALDVARRLTLSTSPNTLARHVSIIAEINSIFKLAPRSTPPKTQNTRNTTYAQATKPKTSTTRNAKNGSAPPKGTAGSEKPAAKQLVLRWRPGKVVNTTLDDSTIVSHLNTALGIAQPTSPPSLNDCYKPTPPTLVRSVVWSRNKSLVVYLTPHADPIDVRKNLKKTGDQWNGFCRYTRLPPPDEIDLGTRWTGVVLHGISVPMFRKTWQTVQLSRDLEEAGWKTLSDAKVVRPLCSKEGFNSLERLTVLFMVEDASEIDDMVKRGVDLWGSHLRVSQYSPRSAPSRVTP